MTNPIATIKLNNGKKIVMKLRPEYAYNEVCSFISAATKGYYDNFAIQRIVPGSWVDVSYNAFFRKECQCLKMVIHGNGRRIGCTVRKSFQFLL